MKITGQFTGARLDLQAWKRKLRQELDIELNRAVRAWLGGVTGRVPVWSGMSQASLLSVSELVGGQLVVSPKGGVKSRIPSGKQLGTAVKEITDTDFTITVTTDVPHYNVQEDSRSARGGSPSAPWKSLVAGAVAFNAVAQDVRLPELIFKPVVRRL